MIFSKKLLKKFNQPETILVLSKYPYKELRHSYHGVAVYTKEVLTAISKKTDQKFVVLVQQEYGRSPELDGQGNILVIPCFSRGLVMFPQLLKTIFSFSQIHTLHIHSEFYTSGEVLQMTASLPFYIAMRALGKEITYFAHNVVDNVSFLKSHLGNTQSALKLLLIQRCLPLYYKLLSMGVDKVVTLDASVKQKLAHFIPERKITLAPIWVYPQFTSQKLRSYWRQKMSYKQKDLVLMVFGFMSTYKGVDWLVETVKTLHKRQQFRHVHLLLAGGKAPSQEGKAHYETFYKKLELAAEKNSYITLTGFIPKPELKRYFAVADLVVLPYRGILGASASWASALSFGKPFIVSKDIAQYLESDDVRAALSTTGTQVSEVAFQRSVSKFTRQLTKVLHPTAQARLQQFSQHLALQRTPEARLLIDQTRLYTPQTSSFSLQWKRVVLRAKALQPRFSA